MVASTGFVGRGTVLKLDLGAGLVAVANVSAISLSGRSVEEVDFTHLGSTGAYREFQGGFIDPGSLQMTVHFDPTNATHSSIEGLIGFSNRDFEVDFSGAGKSKKMTGEGYISGADISVNPGDPVTYDITLRCSGPIAIVNA